MSITELRNDNAEITGYLFVANDNSATQLATDAVKREKDAREMFRLAVEACPSGMLVVDREGKIVTANAAIERQFGYRRDELIGQPVELLVPVHLRRQHSHFRGAFNLQPETRNVEPRSELFGLRKDGSQFSVKVSLNPIQVGGNLMVLTVVADIRSANASSD